MEQHEDSIGRVCPVRTQFVLPETILEGQRNWTILRYACSLQSKSCADDEIYRLASEANEKRCIPPMPESEVREIVQSVTSRYPKGHSADFMQCSTLFEHDESEFSDLIKDGINDRVLSRVFGKMYSPRLRWVCDAHCWYTYDGKRWADGTSGGKELAERFMKEFVERLCRWAASIDDEDTRKKAMKETAKYNTEAKRRNLLNDSHEALKAHLKDFDTEKGLFNVQNGTIALRPYPVFQPHNPADMITKVAECSYDPDAGYGDWSVFLSRTIEGSEDVIPFLQLRMGLALAADTTLECFYIAIGQTRTGKSTFCEALRNVFGDYAGTGDPSTFAEGRRRAQNASPDYAGFRGVRFLTVPELPERMPLDVALIKRLTGGDVITGRGLREDYVTFRPYCTVIVNTNFLPTLSDNTLFTSDRIIVVPFRNKVPKESRDFGLKARMETEEYKSGVLNWLLDGLTQCDTFGSFVPESCEREIAEYRDKSDVLGMFISECCEFVEGSKTDGFAIYSKYSEWSKERHYGTLSSGNFYDKLRDTGYTVRRGIPDGLHRQVRNCVSDLVLAPMSGGLVR